MRPFIREGDQVVITPVRGSGQVVTGDIIAYVRPGGDDIVCHRLLAKRGGMLVVKGDSLVRGRETLGEDLLLGKVVALERDGRRTDLGTGFRKALARHSAWLSSHLPLLLFLLGCGNEVLRRLFRWR
jgi:hypothetical protein